MDMISGHSLILQVIAHGEDHLLGSAEEGFIGFVQVNQLAKKCSALVAIDTAVVDLGVGLFPAENMVDAEACKELVLEGFQFFFEYNGILRAVAVYQRKGALR